MVDEIILCLEKLVSAFEFTIDHSYETSSLVELSIECQLTWDQPTGSLSLSLSPTALSNGCAVQWQRFCGRS